MGFCTQLKLLLWKNYSLRKRQPVRLAIELAWPLVLFIILAWVRTRNLRDFMPECHYDGKAMPSAGALQFLQSFICTSSNTCHQNETQDELPGVVNQFNDSLLTEFINEMEMFLRNESDVNTIIDVIEDFNLLQNLSTMARTGSLVNCSVSLGSILIDPKEIQAEIVRQNISLSQESLQALLDATINLQELQILIDNLGQRINTTNFNISTTVPSDLATTVRDELCTNKQQEYLLVFQNQTTAENALDSLCNLTLEEFVLLVQDFQKDLNLEKVLNEVNGCAQKSMGNQLINNGRTIAEAFKTVQDIQRLSTLGDLTSQLQSSISFLNTSTLQSLINSNGSINGSSSLPFISTLFCGRSQSIFGAAAGFSDVLNQAQGDEKTTEAEQNTDAEKEKEKEEEKEADPDNGYPYDNSTTPFCNSLFKSLNSAQSTRILWRQVKAYIRGKILFTPDTPVVRRIIKEANETFDTLASVQRLAQSWMVISPQLKDFLNNNPAVNQVRGVLDLAAGNPLAGNNAEQIKFLRRYLNNTEPKNPAVYDWRDSIAYMDTVMGTINKYAECFDFDKFEAVENEEELVKRGIEYIGSNQLWGGLVFDIDNATGEVLPSHINYKIRMDRERVDSTRNFKVKDQYWKPKMRANPLVDMKYFTFGFIYLQDLVEHGIIKAQTEKDVDMGVYLQMFPYPCYISDRFVMAISRSMPLFMILAWIYTVSLTVKSIVYEKEARLKEVMKVMGLGNAVHWVAWFITTVIVMFVSILLLIGILKIGKVVEFSDPGVLFFFMFGFMLATITQCFLYSVFFSRANMAAACAGILYFVTYLPYSLVTRYEELMTTSEKVIASLLSNVAFGFGCSYMARYEEQAVGVQWSNIAESPIPGDDFSMLGCIVVLFLDSFIYMVIALYIEAVFPGQYGVPKPWYFLFTKSFWCGHSYGSDGLDPESRYELNETQSGSDRFEMEPKHLKLGVAIQGMKKVYKTGKKVAVDGLNLNFFEGQITSFLGHNGAGKTTTMSILTGLFPPTSGTAKIYGKDIKTDIDEIRKNMGMCPQHNVLFDKLTVEEHLWFYARLKGMSNEDIAEESKKMISDVGLPHKKDTQSEHLSGGMKRKLSIAIAFVAGSKVVILDEPTAGVDPYARRSIWDLLLKYRAGRTIILSTHFMDEADILGDRIAIISSGKLCCCGSSLFLKGKFGNGYYLTLAKNEVKTNDDTTQSLRDVKISLSEEKAEDLTDLPCQESQVTDFITSYVPEAKLMEDIGTELSYQLPTEGAHDGQFVKLFEALDSYSQSLAISSYGIADTTLEEVFLKVAEETGVDTLPAEAERNEINKLTEGGKYARPVTRSSFRGKKFLRQFLGKSKREGLVNGEADDESDYDSQSEFGEQESPQRGPVQDECNGAGSYKVTGMPLILRQFWALFLKRFHYMRRNKKGFIAEIILPAIFVLLAMILSNINPPKPQDPPMEIHSGLLNPKKGDDKYLYMFYSNDKPDEQWTKELEKMLTDVPGIGTRCMDPAYHSIDGYSCDGTTDNMWSKPEKMYGPLVNCSCDTGVQICPSGAGGPEPSKRLLPTKEYLYNMTGRNITDWLVKTNTEYRNKRYGGLAFGERGDVVTANVTMLDTIIQRLLTAANGGREVAVENDYDVFLENLENILSNVAPKRNSKVWFNNNGYPSSVGYMNVLNNLLLRANLKKNLKKDQYGISVTNHPMNRTQDQLLEFTFASGAVDVLIAISVIFAMSFIPASFVLFLIDERISNSKHLQFVSGVNPVIYWTANFCWDIINYTVPCILCVLIFVAFGSRSYVSPDNLPCLIALMLLYGWSIIPLMYPASFLFSTPSTAFVLLSCLNVFLGIVSTISTFILEFFSDEQDLVKINDILRQVFLLLPHYCLGRGLIDMTRNQIMSDVFSRLGEDSFTSPFTWTIVGRNLFAMAFLGVLGFLLTVCIQYKFWTHKCSKKQKSIPPDFGAQNGVNATEDDDVARERRRVTSGNSKDDVLKIENLTKVYTGFRKKEHKAVDQICVGVKKGECFGLLGVNGAGKTSTFKMLTGDTDVTSGNAYLAGHSILSNLEEVHQNLGYCPQFDAICPLLTGKEHLQLYARLRGVPEKDVPAVTEWGIRKLGLLRYADKLAGHYSGGNKRKLSTAIALVGNPPVIFLDEPTTGMDPKARRFLWNCIMQIIKDGRSVILTSHSMEECEALCTRTAIMVNGTFKCLGSIQHLKSKFGDGYTIILRLEGQSPDLEPVMDFVKTTFPNSLLQEKHNNMLQYQLGSEETALGRIFSAFQNVKTSLKIEDYSVSQTTLDHVFINFAKKQTDLEDEGFHITENSQPVANGNGHVQLVNEMTPSPSPYPSRSVLNGNWVDDESLRGSTTELIRPSSASRC